VELGSDINKESNYSNCKRIIPLFYICQRGHEDVVKHLVEHGTNKHKINNNEKTLLSIVKKKWI